MKKGALQKGGNRNCRLLLKIGKRKKAPVGAKHSAVAGHGRGGENF